MDTSIPVSVLETPATKVANENVPMHLPENQSAINIPEHNEDVETLVEPQTFRTNVAELWRASKTDFKTGNAGEKSLILSAGLFQVWNQGRFQQAVTVPAAIDIYISSGGNEVKAALFFAGANYIQNLGMAGTGGAAMRTMDRTTLTFRKNHSTFVSYTEAFVPADKPTVAEYIKHIKTATKHKIGLIAHPSNKHQAEQRSVPSSEHAVRTYVSELVRESTTGQATGAMFPFVAGEVLARPDGSTKSTLIGAERVSRRIAIFSGAIGYGVLKASEEWPDNPVVSNIVEYAQKSWTWFALGGVMFIPSIVSTARKNKEAKRIVQENSL